MNIELVRNFFDRRCLHPELKKQIEEMLQGGQSSDQEKDDLTPQRQFKGVWICAALWDDLDLSHTEKFLIAEIDNLCSGGQACYAGKGHLAKRLHVAPAHMRNMLASLTARGYLLRLAFTGRKTLRCVRPDISSDPLSAQALIKKYKQFGIRDHKKVTPENRSHKKVTPEVTFLGLQGSRKSDTEIPILDTNIETTTKSGSPSLAVNGNGAAHPVVVVSSLASGDEDQRETVDKLTEEFGLSGSQSRLTEDYLNNLGTGYVLEKAELIRSRPRKNLAGAFEKALRDDWKAPKASEPVKQRKAKTAAHGAIKEPADEDWSRGLEAARAMKSALRSN